MTIDKPRKDPKRGFEVGLNLVKFLGLNEQQIKVFEDEIEGSDDFVSCNRLLIAKPNNI